MLGPVAKFGALAPVLLLSPYVSSASTQSTGQKTAPGYTGFPPCDALISAGLGDRILLATSDAYEPRVQSYWSANARLRPWCFVQPHTTEEVSIAVSALANSGSGAGDWHIAVRSGGHSLPGTNNIATGVTIDLGMLNRSFYDPDRDLASVEPGAKWRDVYYNLFDNHNVTVTGGRDGDVGVGGFTTGGGISYYTGRNGFACDTVANFEVVLANGSIVDANAHQNPALWKALKGGSLNFGIVTRFDLQAMPAVDLAFGQSIIASNHSGEVIDAVSRFTDHQEERRDDALITVYMHDTTMSEHITISASFVNTKGDLNTTSFDQIRKIPSSTSSWGLTSLADAANTSRPTGTKDSWMWTTLTFPNSPSILHQSASLYNKLVSSLSDTIGAESFNAQMIFQSLPSYLSTIGQRNGGNMLGLERMSSNSILWTTYIAVKNGDDAAVAVAKAELSAMTSKLKNLASTNDTAVEFIYMNYADSSQDSLGSYGAKNVAFMKDVAALYDPQGWWQRRVPGGFKLARVAT